ncbi:MAG: cofactor-independent phosphoglycerate mutase [Chloroflexi bacterium RBG_16_56_11]|nr:MAG: cofactor-independent phosphoglycerate mutase [Chloroflexi bacterium RBG_16_56_11]
MKYCVLIIDGAAGQPLPERRGRTCLELAGTPNLDAVAGAGKLGLARTVPPGMEPSSACACMSVLGYDPAVYYKGRASIEARSLGIAIAPGEVVFRCNLVTVRDGKMLDYSAGHIGTGEASAIIDSLNKELGDSSIQLFPGVSYRHILKIRGHEDTLEALCTPPHDIPGRPVAGFLPRGKGGAFLRRLMARSETVLRSHQVNAARLKRGEPPVTRVWLFWGSGPVLEMPDFNQVYGLRAAMTSGVDLLRGLAKMAGMDILNIKGVTDGPDSDHVAQAEGALAALRDRDLVVIHIEAPDEAGHEGDVDGKIAAIEKIDKDVVGRLLKWRTDSLRVLVMPDHPTPVIDRTHSADPVPFLIWGKGVEPNGAQRFTEAEARKTGLVIEEGYKIMGKLVGKNALA